jgi:drug/metabolite transporter (DMT)-like permease
VTEPRKPHTFWANVSLATAGSLWGTGFLLGKIAFREMSVAENVCFRFLFASPILLAILAGKRVHFSKKRSRGARNLARPRCNDDPREILRSALESGCAST